MYSWTRTWQPFTSELSGDSPFVVVLAELPGGRTPAVGVLRDGDCADVRIGAPVRGEIDAPSEPGGWPVLRWGGVSRDRTLRGAAAVAGIGATPYYKRGTSPHSARRLILEAILAACADAGVDAHEIDGFVSYANDLNEGLAIGAPSASGRSAGPRWCGAAGAAAWPRP